MNGRKLKLVMESPMYENVPKVGTINYVEEIEITDAEIKRVASGKSFDLLAKIKTLSDGIEEQIKNDV